MTDTQKGKTDTDAPAHRRMRTLRDIQWHVRVPRLNTWIKRVFATTWTSMHGNIHTHRQVIGQATKLERAHYIYMRGWLQSFSVSSEECSWMSATLWLFLSHTNIFISACSHLLEAPGTMWSTAETLCARSDTSRPTLAVTCRKKDGGRGDSRPRLKKLDKEKNLISIWKNERICVCQHSLAMQLSPCGYWMILCTLLMMKAPLSISYEGILDESAGCVVGKRLGVWE